MSRWFRHYAGMMRDDKLVRAAMKSKQTVERVLWVWGALLESAAEVNDGGRFDFDAGEAAYFLRCDESDVGDILAALDAVGRVSGGVVVKWADRQFDSDKSRDRQKRYRDRLKSSGDGDSDVTPPSRDDEMTAQEIDTDTDTSLRSVSASAKPTPRHELETVLDAERAGAVLDHRQRIRKPLTAHAAKLLAGKLAQAADPNAAADTMIANGWMGFEPGWLNRNQPARGSPQDRPISKTDAVSNLRERLRNERRTDGSNAGPDGGNALLLPLPSRAG